MGSLLAALVPLAVWAVPACHPPPWQWVNGGDQGTTVQQQIVRLGLDRHGLVYQFRDRQWDAPTAAALDEVRRSLLDQTSAELPPSQSQWFQLTGYGNDHVFDAATGRQLTEFGGVRTVPYAAVAVAMATPAIGWAVLAWVGFGQSSLTRRHEDTKRDAG